jgi:hypothetical protein
MSQIMKKAILTFGLMSMIMVLTSFTSPNEIGGQKVPTDPNPYKMEIGGQKVPTDPNPLAIGGQKVPTDPLPYTTEIGGQKVPTDPNPLG